MVQPVISIRIYIGGRVAVHILVLIKLNLLLMGQREILSRISIMMDIWILYFLVSIMTLLIILILLFIGARVLDRIRPLQDFPDKGHIIVQSLI
ncbi:membrane protein [Candidatus Omnitrophus magneticus]|uniref:Membrane protein n=1 Tax=Candidatus Omnitrophus magneticus TaxID=1609969 RepID=A0A0F0CX25_9BACT|nr:membrane protein [Candidatus Omnitrophus magneticus]